MSTLEEAVIHALTEDEHVPTYGEQRSQIVVEYDAEVLERVMAGIAWLEATVGPDWVESIDLSMLDLTSAAACVLGQVFAEDAAKEEGYMDDGYGYALSIHDELDGEGGAHGFTTEDEEWDVLQETWERVLTPMVGSRG